MFFLAAGAYRTRATKAGCDGEGRADAMLDLKPAQGRRPSMPGVDGLVGVVARASLAGAMRPEWVVQGGHPRCPPPWWRRSGTGGRGVDVRPVPDLRDVVWLSAFFGTMPARRIAGSGEAGRSPLERK